MRVLVTGSCGVLGRTAVDALVRAGHRVRSFDLPTRRNRRLARRWRGVEALWGDIRQADAVAGAVAGQEVVIHGAAILAPASEARPELSHAVNVDGTARVLEAAARQEHPPALIYPSSLSVYGPCSEDRPPRKADDPVRPTDHYTQHKVTCESLIRDSGLRWLIMRVGVALATRPLRFEPEVLRLMFDVSPVNRLETVAPQDVARAMVNALDRDDAWFRVLPIGGGPTCQIRQRELLNGVFGAVGLSPLPEAAMGDRPFYTDWLDTRESQAMLRYQRISFEAFCQDAARELRWVRRLLWPLRPIARWALLRYSRPWQDRRRR